MRKIISIILASLFIMATMTSCGGTNASQNSTGAGESETGKIVPGKAEIWSASTAETVLLNKPVEDYENIKLPATIDIGMAKNEYEGAQLFLTAEQKVNSYDIKVHDLKTADGKVYSAENIDVFSYKYMLVTTNVASHRKIGTGYYPDAILPFEATKAFGENYVEKGQNQGVYIRFYTPENCVAGIYSGFVTVICDGNEVQVPITLKVWDIMISEENHLKTLFLNGWFWQSAELNGTEEKYYDYVELLSEYRLSPYFLMTKDERDTALDDYYDRYAEVVYNYTKDPKHSCFALNFVYNGDTFDTVAFEKMLLTLADKSFETKFNVLTKAIAHFNSIIDEATMQGKLAETIKTTNDFRSVRTVTAQKIRSNKNKYVEQYGVDGDFVEEVATTIENIPHLFVSNYDPEYAPYINEDGTGTGEWCPNVWEFQDSKNVETYIDDIGVNWWYGCGGSSRYIPSYQLDDYTLSPRIMPWQQLYYGITGNLYWGVDINADIGDGGWKEVEDWYDHNAAVGGINGDGQLMYPGGQYELDMPVATRRLEAIRDGMEEYEMLYELKNLYKAVDADAFDKVYDFLTKDLFAGIEIIATADNFAKSKNLMAELLMLAKSDANAIVTELNASKTNLTGKIFVKNGFTVTDGENELAKTPSLGGNVYSFDFALDNYSNVFTLTIPELTKDNSLTFVSRGKAVFYAPDEDMLQSVSNGFARVTKSLVLASEVGVSANSEKLIKLDISETNQALQSIKLQSDILTGIGKTTSSIKFFIYNDSGENKTLSIEAKFSGERIISQLMSVELCEGWNEITISGIDQKPWNTLNELSYLQMVFGNTTNEPALSGIYLGGYYITYLQ